MGILQLRNCNCIIAITLYTLAENKKRKNNYSMDCLYSFITILLNSSLFNPLK